MRVDNGLSGFFERWANAASARINLTEGKAMERAQDLLDAAKENISDETMRAWDKHTDMVQKSQELREVRDRKEAMERLTQEHREEQTELMAQMAIENVNRSRMLEAQSLERESMMLVA